MSLLVLFAWIGVNSAAAQVLRWKTIVGVKQIGDEVSAGGGAVADGYGPWETLGGSAMVNLNTGAVSSKVEGLVLAAGSLPSQGVTGLPIGTPGPVTQVAGTLIDVDGTANGGNSIDVMTPATALGAHGYANFSGSFLSSLPPVCSSENDDAFAIRIVRTLALLAPI
jgi:hypothetical protein